MPRPRVSKRRRSKKTILTSLMAAGCAVTARTTTSTEGPSATDVSSKSQSKTSTASLNTSFDRAKNHKRLSQRRIKKSSTHEKRTSLSSKNQSRTTLRLNKQSTKEWETGYALRVKIWIFPSATFAIAAGGTKTTKPVSSSWVKRSSRSSKRQAARRTIWVWI